MRALIVGKTKMAQRACVGALSLSTGQSLRLFNDVPGPNRYPLRSRYDVGDLWDLKVKKSPEESPHIEGVIVKEGSFISTDADPRSTILSLITPWEQTLASTFDGTLFSDGGKYFLRDGDPLPDRSTWFWIPPHRLKLNGRHYLYEGDGHEVVYTGIDPPAPVIEPGTLVRLSLAGWWNNNGALPEHRCYLQVSGSFR